MRRLLLRLLINALGLYIAVRFVPGVRSEGSWLTFIALALILGIANALVRPLLALLTCPLIILTLGLFTLVINALVLWLAGSVGASLGLSFEVDGFVPAFWAALLLSLVNWVATMLLGDTRRAYHRQG